MQRPVVPLFLLLTVTTLTGLAAEHRLEYCGDGTASLLEQVLCDPDHLVPPVNSHVIIQLLTKCGENTGHKLVVFLAATLPPYDKGESTTTTTTTGAKQSSGGGGHGDDGDRLKDMTHLKEMVVTANNLTTTTFPVILLIVIKEKLQMATWWSDSLSDVLTSTTVEEAQQNASTLIAHHHFTSAVVQVACYLCQSARGSSSRSLQYIILTIVWIAFTAAFVALLVIIAVVLIKARVQAVKGRATASQQRSSRQAVSPSYPRVSDTHDFSQVSFKSTGHVLLGTTDIAAMPSHDCTSTDNLLENC